VIVTSLASALQRGFSRVTSTVDFIPQIDGIRFVAMMLVLLHHVFASYLEYTHRLGTNRLPDDWGLIAPRSHLVSWALHLWIGVPMFCVISGFVLAIPFARSYQKHGLPPSRRLYLLRRLIRMEPPYFINMIFMFLVLVVSWLIAGGRNVVFVDFKVFFPHLLASLAYAHAQIYGTPSWINGVAWTLEIEVQFYLVLPFVAELFRVRNAVMRRAILFCLVLFAALVSQFIVLPTGNARLLLSLPVQLQFFIAGVLLADLHLNIPAVLNWGWRISDAAAMLSAAGLVYVLHWRPQFAAAEPFLLLLLFLSVMRGRWTARALGSPWLTIPGGMCYTIYLYHFLIVRQLLPFTVRLIPPVHRLSLDTAAQFVLLLLPIVAVCGVLYLFTERPFVVLSHNVARRFRKAPAGQVAA
jgi:peptidoglycan/LPS O-acetylase OafA/YrhL